MPTERNTSISQKLRRVLLLVGVVDSPGLPPDVAVPAPAWVRVVWDGLVLKTREPLRCLGLSLGSLTSGGGLIKPADALYSREYSGKTPQMPRGCYDTNSPLASSAGGLAARRTPPTHRGLGRTRSSIKTSHKAWRSAPCSLSLNCRELTFPCSQMSKRTKSLDSAGRAARLKTLLTTT